MFETLKQMKSDKKQVFADIVYFDLIYPSEKKRENSNRGQKMSAKICQKFLYCDLTLDTEAKFFQDFQGLKITYIAHEHELSYALEKLDTGRYQIGV